MKKVVVFLCTVFLISGAHAIGLQHGLFRSQSTQGAAWQGTAEIINEHFDITVYPDFLDVELEWEFKAGGTAPNEYADALEIVGNINFAENSVVVSMITWYKDMILKGKLKTNDIARSQYEKVVQRSSDAPPPPRDPVLLELISNDNYDISIFPVEFGKTRKVRIRYLIPAFEINGINKIAYPHAFTDKATVEIMTGSGVYGYDIETALEILPYYKLQKVKLDCNKFEFRSYSSGTGKESIKYIVPKLDKEPSGSVIYSGAFSTESMSGEVSHVITMSADRALLKTSIPQDFVILWRWNHPEILSKYAGQIVSQSKQLIKFLNALSEHGKRAAMIVSIQGGEKIIFELNAPGSDEFKRMIRWLEDQSKKVVVEPKVTNNTKPAIEFDFDKSIREFNDALQAAIDMFDSGSFALKQLIMLTAGPRIVTVYKREIHEIKIDSLITLKALSAYEESGNTSSIQRTGDRVYSMYWPGVDINSFFSKNSTSVKVTATVGNGDKSYIINVSPIKDPDGYNSAKTTTEAHLFSNKTLKKEILWRVEFNLSMVEFHETPTVISIEDGLQYARLIGSSKYLNPLAEIMPSSIASSVGFIDEKYSLVALEDDALAKEFAAQYNDHGVPLLEPEDIFAASDETSSMPVAEWIKENPPQSMAKTAWGNIHYVISGRGVLMSSVKYDSFTQEDNPGRITIPSIDPVYAEALIAGYNYDDLLVAKSNVSVNLQERIQLVSKRGSIEINVSGINNNDLNGISLVIYDLNGRLLKSIKLSSVITENKFNLSRANTGLTCGSYVLKLQGKGIIMSKRFVLQ